LLGLLLRFVRAGQCRGGHDPIAYGGLSAHRALDSRERLSCETVIFVSGAFCDGDRVSRPGSSGGFDVEIEPRDDRSHE
jgi:hypothetical protein